jgi:hypothetical protein
VVLTPDEPEEHGFGRPWITKVDGRYQLMYSIRRRSLAAYRLGYAESHNAIDWLRKDGDVGLTVSSEPFEDQAVMYSAMVHAHGKTYCFYNGNEFGRYGFAIAELVTDS